MKPKNSTGRLKRHSLRAFQELKKVANKEETITYGELGKRSRLILTLFFPKLLDCSGTGAIKTDTLILMHWQ